MARTVSSAVSAFAATIAVALPSFASSPLQDTARVEVLQGRAIVLEEDADPVTVRRGAAHAARGRAQLEIGAGSFARISWDGTCSAHLWGPASIEWSAPNGSVELTFHELSWADLEARSGRHQLHLPAEWHGTFERSSFHLRGLSGGPTEVRLHAGEPIVLDWRGGNGAVRPPLAVYPGSSVRLDRPRYVRNELASRRPKSSWPRENDQKRESWPWRERADTPRQSRERVTLDRETQSFDEFPGEGSISAVRSYEADGSSRVAPIRERSRRAESRADDTLAQVPVVPPRPRVEIEPRRRPTTPNRSTEGPTSAEMAKDTGWPLSSHTPSGTKATRRAPAIERSSDTGSEDRAARSLAGRSAPFDPTQWRGLQLRQLNGTGQIAAERATGVEVRILGQGRAKVFVSSGAPGPRWCFTPTTDLLMKPGAVAVFESDGTVRMSFGEIEEHDRVAGRPSYGELGD
ncbi:MAG: hypothetical protein AAGA20_10985 [Planctomycetota bacterium]